MGPPVKKKKKAPKPDRNRLTVRSGMMGAGSGGALGLVSANLLPDHPHWEQFLRAVAPSVAVGWIWLEPRLLDGAIWLFRQAHRKYFISRGRAALERARQRFYLEASDAEKPHLKAFIDSLEKELIKAEFDTTIVATINQLSSPPAPKPPKIKKNPKPPKTGSG